MDGYKRWALGTLLATGLMLVAVAGVTAVIDPYFHYHKPLEGLEYPINNERYMNDGILRHFDYDAIIIGTSMTENFKASEFDRLFEAHSVKTPFSGGYYKEIHDSLERAVEANPGIRYILRCLDYSMLITDKDAIRTDVAYPTYLYDDKLHNDVNYLLNKSILRVAANVLAYTRAGGETTSFDDYANWAGSYTFGKEAVDASYTRPEKAESVKAATEEDYRMVKENLEQNVLAVAQENPQIEFYLFFPPYSIYWWDSINQEGDLDRRLELEKAAIEMLLDQENIRLFSFCDEFGLVCDLNNYKDVAHYSGEVNSQMLQWMAKEEHLLTRENYQEYCRAIRDFYANYDYDALFEP